MAELDEQRRRLTVKLVYYGPAMSGKTTNLTRLHDLLAAELKGDIMTLETDGDRTLFFDLLPLGFTAPSGLLVKFKVFTVPGQVAHDGTRKAVLSRADGVVFVADSRRHQASNNASSFENLMANLAILGLDGAVLPLVVQFNKRDLPDILSEAEIAARWAQAPWPLLFAAALEGGGVLATFAALLDGLYDSLDRQFALGAAHGLTRAAFCAALGARP
ncbi:GTP-binding protein [Janthinobacterium fluminis]|uniref:GTPase domain-containing protein n=1 Tax=Janthinobacterium fluminis TaxID=2987524 RepID=A0ABT5K610_9BURK|nr:GTPase domain-containing protein [Janthinobacterium fluminis]MDC8759521.1 GTPase domain-containing protein [Janthinobacterium fluminis]